MGKVAWDYIVDVKMPKDLKGVTPGELPDSLLVPIPGGGKLHHLAAKAWLAMVAAAKADGIELKPTSAGDTYRTLAAQLAGFKQRYQLEDTGTGSTRTYEGKKWFLKKGMAPLAAPGSSKHNLGIAVDVANAADKKRIEWLIANVKKFGFSWEVVPEEPWHLRYVEGDNLPAAVAEFADATPAAAPAPAAKPAAAPAGKAPAFPGAPLTAGATGDAVKALQQKLGVAVTGTFDAATGKAVKAFKNSNGLGNDEIAGPKVWQKLFGA